MNPTFWRGKRVLITGHTGFKGSWFSLWLQAVGADVVGYALEPPTDPNMFTLCSGSLSLCDSNPRTHRGRIPLKA